MATCARFWMGVEDMARIISLHSFRGGAGKSNTAANVAGLLAAGGRRVGVVDADIQSPGIHVLFGVPGSEITGTLNDYLWGKCGIADTAHDVTPAAISSPTGRIFLIPSSMQAGEITRVVRQGYDAQRMIRGLKDVIDWLRLDVLIIDTHPGLNEETLLAIAIAHTLAILLRPDSQDYEGTGVTVQVARKLEVPNMMLVVNKMPDGYDAAAVEAQMAGTYGCPVAAVIPHSDKLMRLASGDIFALRFPEHSLTGCFRQLAARLMG